MSCWSEDPVAIAVAINTCLEVIPGVGIGGDVLREEVMNRHLLFLRFTPQTFSAVAVCGGAEGGWMAVSEEVGVHWQVPR
jgi:hypothetical protein